MDLRDRLRRGPSRASNWTLPAIVGTSTSVPDANQTVTAKPTDDGQEDLSVAGVFVFLLKWLFNVMIELWLMLPFWLRVAVAVLLFIRYLMMPLSKCVRGRH